MKGTREKTTTRTKKSSSRLLSALAILGLILVSLLMVLVVNASPLSNPTIPLGNNNPNGKPGPTGTLWVQLLSNQNETDRTALPTTNQLYPLEQKGLTVTQETNSSNPAKQFLFTNTAGRTEQDLPPGSYVVSLEDESLGIKVPVSIHVGNVTRLTIYVNGSAYPLAYSEESGVILTTGNAQSAMYAQIDSSAIVASPNEPVVLKVLGSSDQVGHIINATVVSQEAQSKGTDWLELGTASALDPVNATSIYLTTWTYSSTVTTQVIGLGGVSV